jgi:hypothetical protein
MAVHELIDLEREAWKALSTSGAEAAAFYERTLADEVLMLLPGGMVIDDRQQVISSMQGEPWSSYELDDERVLAVVAYRGRARRGDTDYAALFNSTYVRVDGSWRLAVHQQTPI